MGRKAILSVLLLAAVSVWAFPQSRETGAISGKVIDDQKNALPGVTVTLTGTNLMGRREFITDTQGIFRFPALPPGEYTIKAALGGFKAVQQTGIRLTTTVTLSVDLVMTPSNIAEEVTVQAKAPTIDVKSTETASVTLSNEILRNIPYSQFTADIVNLAPGVNDNVAYGASQDTGIAYTVDGVNVADPEAGSAWVFLDHNIIEEAKVMGVGLPAEYGNFTGVIFNLVTKSGGNAFSGHIELDYQGRKSDGAFWQADNTSPYSQDFSGLTPPASRFLDGSVHLGGPITKDKLWFYTGVQWYQAYNYVTGFPNPDNLRNPHWFGKLSAAPSATLTLTGTLEIDTYLRNNRGAAANVAPVATVSEDSPEIVGNFNLTKILGKNTFFDVKAAYFWGYYYLNPNSGENTNAHIDLDNNNYLSDSSGYYFKADRTRLQVNANLTHYTENLITGTHDFKFGVEVEHSTVRDRYGYTGANHMKYFDNGSEPYLAYQYAGYDTLTTYTRLEAFAQDSWQITNRLNINIGARFTHGWGYVEGTSSAVYTPTRLAPRIGFTYDLLGDKSTILKAHYGQFTEAILSTIYSRLNPASAFNDYVGYYWDGSAWQEFTRTQHENLYSLDPNIHQPYLDQFTVGLERELFKDTSLSVTYIYRDWKNIIDPYDALATYVPMSFTVPQNGQTYTIYDRTSGDAHEYILTNIKSGDNWVLSTPYRRYSGIEFVLNKRYSDRWQLIASYVYSRAWGTLNNGFGDDLGYGSHGGLSTADPNFWINADGNLTSNPTHQIKIQGTYMIPGIEVAFNVYFHGITGDSWQTSYTTPLLNQGRVTFFVEPRGSHQYNMAKLLDLRLEKVFLLANRYRLGLIFDVFNVFNDNTITSWGTNWGSGEDYYLPGESGYTASTDGHYLYGIVNPRQARLGIRLTF
ncbi:MAG: TonB-dependent receptor [Candidatus Aminicenantales bacterium]|jgi:hypothetical protein